MNEESIRIEEALRTTIEGGEEMDGGLHQLVHDVQSCLQVIGLGTELLKGAREDEAGFTEIADRIDHERRAAARLLTEYLRSAQGKE